MEVAKKRSFLAYKNILYPYLKMIIDEMYSTNQYLLMSELKIIDANNNNYPFLTANMDIQLTNLTPTGTNENGFKLFDRNINTKLCASRNPTSIAGQWIIQAYTGDNGIDISQYNRWQWYTANDTAINVGRNPKHFSLYLSKDGNEWILVDTGSTSIISNYALAYTGNITI